MMLGDAGRQEAQKRRIIGIDKPKLNREKDEEYNVKRNQLFHFK